MQLVKQLKQTKMIFKSAKDLTTLKHYSMCLCFWHSIGKYGLYTVILCAILGPAEVANIGKCYNLISHNISTQFTQIDEKVVWMLYIC